ncbi:hypothetical protein HMPREF1985_00235 [Mitsuokella sp. oral taxon 131 str. W9106]|nr:hypothetical protein HMPREF1985_00235 [Mitsuokella sp. oral taxon 131 str. W9106]
MRERKNDATNLYRHGIRKPQENNTTGSLSGSSFLETMESIVPWNEWMKLIAPFYVQKGHGRERDSTGNHAADAPHAELVRSFWRGHRGGHLRQLRHETLSED